MLPYKGCKIYGPYTRKDKRQHVVVIFPDKSRKTVSYPKFLMEQRLGRYLQPHETVDHKDCNSQNNNPYNLQVLTKSEHSALDVKRVVIEGRTFECPWCEGSFFLGSAQIRKRYRNRSRVKAGPFCSRSCSGKYGAAKQNGRIDEPGYAEFNVKYTTLKKLSLQEETLEVDNSNSGKP